MMTYLTWRKIDGSDKEYIDKVLGIDRTYFIDVYSFSDGIHELSVDDYWNGLMCVDEQYAYRLRPIFKYTSTVFLIKKNGYLMFISKGPDGSFSILNGAKRKKAIHDLSYYYENLERYAHAVEATFRPYWEALYKIADQVKNLSPNKAFLQSKYSKYVQGRERAGKKALKFDLWYKEHREEFALSGNVHGCIVDIDYFNHLYLNPFDGSIIPYYAVSMYDKDVYNNTVSLLSAKRPEMLASPQEAQLYISAGSEVTSLVAANHNAALSIIRHGDIISKKHVKEYSHEMYRLSNRLLELQSIFDYKLIKAWYDNVLRDDSDTFKAAYLKPPAVKTSRKEKYLFQSKDQPGNHTATITEYRKYKDIDVSFEDGTVLEHVTVREWKDGVLKHPDLTSETEPVSSETKESISTAAETIPVEPVIDELSEQVPEVVSTPIESEEALDPIPIIPVMPVVQKKEGNSKTARFQNQYLGLTLKMRCGLYATIIRFYKVRTVTVQFEDGLIRENVLLSKFLEGNIAHVSNLR